MFQLAFGGRQSLRDLTQAVGPPQLAEQHGDELAPAGEASRVPLGFVFMHRRLELDAGKQLENLAENAAYCTHGGCLSGEEVVLSGPSSIYSMPKPSRSKDCPTAIATPSPTGSSLSLAINTATPAIGPME